MARRKRHWLWNLLLALSLVVCGLAFAVHSRNWTRLHPDRMQLLSGLYYVELPYSQLQSLQWVQRVPHMERESGFSAGAREKGIFLDSLQPEARVRVFVDDLRQEKIKIQYRDSMLLYLNFADSTETRSIYELLAAKKEEYATMDRQ